MTESMAVILHSMRDRYWKSLFREGYGGMDMFIDVRDIRAPDRERYLCRVSRRLLRNAMLSR
jgi:hypothetical protein